MSGRDLDAFGAGSPLRSMVVGGPETKQAAASSTQRKRSPKKRKFKQKEERMPRSPFGGRYGADDDLFSYNFEVDNSALGGISTGTALKAVRNLNPRTKVTGKRRRKEKSVSPGKKVRERSEREREREKEGRAWVSSLLSTTSSTNPTQTPV